MEEHMYFEKFIDEYADEIISIQPEFYKNAARFINKELEPGSLVIDIGNGGVINYNYKNLKELICLDLKISEKAVQKYKKVENIKFCEGNVLDLKEITNSSVDTVILQTVIHHLAGKTFKNTQKNVTRGIEECMRILKPGGKLLIVESVVFPWFEMVERMLYSFMQLFFKIIHFDTVYQYSYRSLLKKIKVMNLCVEESSMVEVDKYIWLCRKKIPSKITPCRACWIMIRKEK